MNSILEKLYFDPKVGYSGLNTLFRQAVILDPKIKKSDVRAWLHQHSTYTLHKYARRKFARNRVLVSRINEQWQIDLVDLQSLSKFNGGYKYLLNCIDLFSKFAFSIALKSKRAEEIVEAFKKILASGQKPEKVQADAGTEFVNKPFQDFLTREGIDFFTTNSEMKASVVERFNRTLKEKMFRYFTKNNTYKYTDVLPELMHAYNNANHRTIGMAPAEVNPKNEQEIRERVFRLDPDYVPIFKFKVGDKVRISKMKRTFEKGYTPNWTEETFIVQECNNRQPPVYTLKDQMGEMLGGVFYEPEMQKVEIVDNVYIIEKVIKTRKRGEKREYFVKWRGYPDKFNSWVSHLIKL